MKHYYCNEDDRILSLDEIKAEFDMFRSEGQYTDVTFPEYIDGCMYTNNGALVPLAEHVDFLRRELARIRSYDDENNDEWIRSLADQLADCEKYMEA